MVSTKVFIPAAPNAQRVVTENRAVVDRFPRYVVVRDGYRVSDTEYNSSGDPDAIAEAEFWDRVATRHSWGERVDIVEYNNKYHRVY
jgi:hypothetical protein